MTTEIGVNYLTQENIFKNSIWRFDDRDDLLYPVNLDDSSTVRDQRDLYLRAKFKTPGGLEFIGYLVGLENIFSIGIFFDEHCCVFNQNLKNFYKEEFKELSTVMGKNITLAQFSPLTYETDVDLPGFKNFEGEFDLTHERTDKERLGDLWTGD